MFSDPSVYHVFVSFFLPSCCLLGHFLVFHFDLIVIFFFQHITFVVSLVLIMFGNSVDGQPSMMGRKLQSLGLFMPLDGVWGDTARFTVAASVGESGHVLVSKSWTGDQDRPGLCCYYYCCCCCCCCWRMNLSARTLGCTKQGPVQNRGQSFLLGLCWGSPSLNFGQREQDVLGGFIVVLLSFCLCLLVIPAQPRVYRR